MNYQNHKKTIKKLPHKICGNFLVNIAVKSIKTIENTVNLGNFKVNHLFYQSTILIDRLLMISIIIRKRMPTSPIGNKE